jgi:hypothetical protein
MTKHVLVAALLASAGTLSFAQAPGSPTAAGTVAAAPAAQAAQEKGAKKAARAAAAR